MLETTTKSSTLYSISVYIYIYTRNSNLFSFKGSKLVCSNRITETFSAKISSRPWDSRYIIKNGNGTGLIHRVRASCLVERDPGGNRPITCWLVKHRRREEGKIKRDQAGEGVVWKWRRGAITREGSSGCRSRNTSCLGSKRYGGGIPKRSPIKTFPIDFPRLNSTKSKVSS